MTNRNDLNNTMQKGTGWRRMLALLCAFMLLITSTGITVFAEEDDGIISDPVTAPVNQTAEETPGPDGDVPEGGEDTPEGTPEETTEEVTEDVPEETPEETPEPTPDRVYYDGTLTAEIEGCSIRAEYTAEARIPEDAELKAEIVKGSDLYTVLKAASRAMRDEGDETWARQVSDELNRFYALTITDAEGNEIKPYTGITLAYTNPASPEGVVYFLAGSEARVLEDEAGSLSIDGYEMEPFGYATVEKVQVGTVTLEYTGEDYTVTAAYGPEAGFPADTELKVKEILPGTSEYAMYSGLTEDTLNEAWSEITLERFFDITFVSGGAEMEPQADVDVQIIFNSKIELTEEHDVTAVHIENNEATVIASDTESSGQEAQNDGEAIDTVAFTSDSFSVYGVVQRTKITSKVLAADGQTYEIEVTYGPEAEIPEDAELRVTEIPEGSDLWEAYRKQTAAALGADDVRLPGLYDITILDAEGNEVEPKAPVNVSIKLANADEGEDELHVVHFTEEIPEELVEAAAEQTEVQPLAEEDRIDAEHITDTTVDGQTVTFETEGFSVYAFAYTVVVYYKVATGETYRFRLDYDADSGIPAGSVLKAEEILPEDPRYAGYLEQAIKAAAKTAAPEGNNETAEAPEPAVPDDQYARFFDIEIQFNGQKVDPTGIISVTVELADAPEGRAEELTVVHFAEEGTEILSADVTAEAIQFEAESFSVYGVLTVPAPSSVNNLNGYSVKISNLGYYVGAENITVGDSRRLSKTDSEPDAPVWTFEAAGAGNQYYIYTETEAGKQYINIIRSTDQRGDAILSGEPQALTVEQYGNQYRIQGTNNGGTYYLNQFDNTTGIGFAGWWYSGSGEAQLDFTFVPAVSETNNKEYMVVVKQGDAYYVVLNDGTLSFAQYNEANNTVAVTDPMMWKYDGERLYHPTREAGFTKDDIASASYYRYIDPNSPSGLNEDDETNTERIGTSRVENGVVITNRQLWDTVKFSYTDHKLQSVSNPEFYIGIDENGRLKGQATAGEAAEVFLADPLVLGNDWKRHSVGHIDISINGTAEADVPLANGKYYDENGNVVKEVQQNRFEKLHLTKDQVVDPEELGITPEDMKRARITAVCNGKVLDNAFYITGYSGNAEHGGQSGDETDYITSPQIRIEGSFLVAKMPERHATIDESLYDSVYQYRKDIRDEHLANQVEYNISVVKTVEFYLQMKVTDDNGETTYQQLYDADGNALTTKVDMAFTDSFSYWENGNECPVFTDVKEWYYYKKFTPNWPYENWAVDSWEAGDVARCGFSGMDFKLGGEGTGPNIRVYSIEITKIVVDEQGNRIKSDNIGTTKFSIFRKPVDTIGHAYDSAGYEYLDVVPAAADEAKDLNVGSFTSDEAYAEGYTFVRDKTIQVGNDGFGLVYDYDVTPALYYVEEDPDSVTESITDTTGKQWNYKETYIWTEYAWRNCDNDNYMHIGRTYDEKPAEGGYKSVPEILGNHYSYDGNDGPYTNDFLEFYVYNVYESPKVDVPVIKSWEDFDDDTYAWEASFKLQWAPVYPGETKPTVAFQDVSPVQAITITKEKMEGLTPELIQDYLGGGASLTQEQKDRIDQITFTNLPKYGTDAHGNTFRYQYSLEETSYRVLNTTTGVYEYTWSKEEGYNDPEESTHYSPFYPHDAGEIEESEEAAADNTNYYIEVSNQKKVTRDKEYINVSLSKQWDPPQELDNDSYAEFELRRFEHTEYRDLSHMSDADRTADPVTVTITDGGNTVSTLQVQPNMGLYLGGNFKPHESEKTVTFTAEPAVRLANGSRTSTITVQAGGQNMSNALVRSQEFFVVADTVFTIADGIDNLVDGNPARVLDTGAGTSPQPDRSFSQTIRLDNTNGWHIDLSDLLLNETMESEDDNENVTCYEYYFVEKSSSPDGYAQFFRANIDGTPSAVLSGDSDHQIESNDSIVAVNGPSNRLIVKKLWRGVPDATGFPQVTFTLYQAWADGNEGWVYENPDTHARYENIELSGNSLEWICPEVLPDTKLDNGRSRAVKYYVQENERQGSMTENGMTVSWQFYYYLSSYHVLDQGGEREETKQTNAGHQGYFASVPGSDLLRSGGTITICNKLNNYMQLDIQKQFFRLEDDGSWNNVTASSDMRKNVVLGFRVIRAIKTPDGKWLDEQGNEHDTPVWMNYGEEMLCGYDENGQAIVHRGENDIFWLRDAGGDWHFRIEDNQGDANNVNAGGSGLPGYGFFIRNGEDLTVEYWYSFRETGIYKDLNRTPYPEWDWYSSITPVNAYGPNGTMQAFPKAYGGQDASRVANFQASNLIIDKEWIGEPDAAAVYVKIWRTSGDGAPEDFTAIIANDVQNNHNWQTYVSDASTIDVNRKCLVIKPDSDGNWETDIKVNRALLGSLAETGEYSYYIQEIGYRDNNGTYKTNVNAAYRPLYTHWEGGASDGHWADPPVQMNEYADNSITIGEKGENKLKVINRNTESSSYTVTKTFYGSQSSTGGQSTISGYPTDGSAQVVVKLQQRYRYEKTEGGTEYVSADGNTWVRADSEAAASAWTQDWQDAESASPLCVTLPQPKPAGSILSDSTWYGSAAAWTYTWEGLDVKKLMSGSDETGDAVYAQLYYRAAEHEAPEWFNAAIPSEEQNGHKAVSDDTQTQQQILAEKNSVINERKVIELDLSKQWTSLSGSVLNWPDGYTIDYQLVQYYHLAQADLSDPANPVYSLSEIFKTADMSTSYSGAQEADNVHPQAIGLNVGKPTDGTDVIAEIKGLPLFGYYTATADDVAAAAEAGISLTEGTVYPVVYTYGAKETDVKKNGMSILAEPKEAVDSERDTTETDSILYKATLTNELDEIDLILQKTWTRNGETVEFPDGYKIAWKLIRTDSKGNEEEILNSGKFTKATEDGITTVTLADEPGNTDERLTKDKPSVQVTGLPTGGVADGEEVTYTYQFVEDPEYSEKPANSNYTFQPATATAADAADEDGFIRHTLNNDLTDVEVTKTWEGTPYADSVTVKLYRTTEIPEDQLCQVTVNVSFGTDFDQITDSTITATVAGKTVTLTKDGDNDLWTGTVGLERGTSANLTFDTIPSAGDDYTVTLNGQTIEVADAETQTVNITGTVSAKPTGRTITLTVNWSGDNSWASSLWTNVLQYQSNSDAEDLNGDKPSLGSFSSGTSTLSMSNLTTDGYRIILGEIQNPNLTGYDVSATIGTLSNNWDKQIILDIPGSESDQTVVLNIEPKQQSGGSDTKTLSYTVNNNSSMGDGDGFWFNVRNAVYGGDGNWWGPFTSGTQLGSFNITKYEGTATRTFTSNSGPITGFMLQYGTWGSANTISFSGTGVQSEGTQLVYIPVGCTDFVITINPQNRGLGTRAMNMRTIAQAPKRAAADPSSIIINMGHTAPVIETEYVNAPDVSGMGDPIDVQVLTADSVNADGTVSWYYMWSDLPAKDPETGATYHYYVVEQTPANTQEVTYTRTESSSGTSVTIHNKPGVLPDYASFTVTKSAVEKDTNASIETERLFTIRLKREKNNTTEWLNYTDSTHYSWGTEDSASTWTFNNGGSISFTGLDTGYVYTAVEDTGTGMVEIPGYDLDSGSSTTAASVTASGAIGYEGSITNRYTLSTGSVRVTKVFEFPDGSGLTAPETFQIRAEWGEGADAHDILLKPDEDTDTSGLTGITVTRSGQGTEDEPYTWTISGLLLGTVVSFEESGYQITGYTTTVTVTPDPATATVSADPGDPSATAAFVNTYSAHVELPITGGPGTLAYTAGGLALALLAGAMLLARRKRKNM